MPQGTVVKACTEKSGLPEKVGTAPSKLICNIAAEIDAVWKRIIPKQQRGHLIVMCMVQ